MNSQVFNAQIGSPYGFDYPNLTKNQELEIIAGLFEQLLLFDKIVVSTNRLNFALFFLIKNLGINTVERLFESEYIKILIWTPFIFTSGGMHKDDGTIDESAMYGQPPITGGHLSGEDLDPENNIQKALSHFQIIRERKRIFTKIAANNYIVPDGSEFTSGASKLIIDSYKNNSLSTLGLPFEREPNQLHKSERMILLDLGHKVVETAMLSKYGYKSYENYEHYAICRQNIINIGKAYNIEANTDHLFKIEGLPNLKELFLSERLDFEKVFKLRHISSAKFYRKWINEIGENSNATEISKEYINQVKGKSKFFETSEGKFLKTLFLYGADIGLGAAIAGVPGIIAGFSLSLLETYFIDNLLKGKNPSMFIDQIKDELKK